MANIEKMMKQPSLTKDVEPATREEASELHQQFLHLKPEHASNTEAAQAALGHLEALAAKHGQTVDDLLREAHTTENTLSHHIQALTLERMLGYLHR